MTRRLEKDREANREYLRRWRKDHPGKKLAETLRWQRANPEKLFAHKRVYKALKIGDLIRQPCFCGAPAHAHHDDYSKPLEVIWLCPLHHKERHRLLDAKGETHDSKS